nr:reverse transcriptase domain-containing protein [Tanacetum cinerariifolium]
VDYLSKWVEAKSLPTNDARVVVKFLKSLFSLFDEQNTEEILDKEHSNSSGSTAQVQPPVVPISIPKPNVSRTQKKPTIPYLSRLNDQKLREKTTNQMEIFFQIFHDLHFNISFADDLLLMPKFASTLKSLLANKDKLFELAKVPLNENCSAMLLKKLPEKLGDPGKFLILCDFTEMEICHALTDLGASINLMPLSIWKKLSLPELTPTRMTLELADSQSKSSSNLREVLLENRSCFNQCIWRGKYPQEGDILFLEKLLNEDPFQLPPMDLKVAEESKEKSSIEEPPELELKELPSHLEYAFLEDSNKLPVIIAKNLKVDERKALINVLKSHKRAISWKIYDIKGIDPRFCTHKILMEDDYKPAAQSQRRVNPKIHDVIKKEVIKLLDAGMIYLISDSPWVSPIHFVPKKGGMTVVANENNELIPTRLVTGWRVCIYYWKLNDATRKGHFPLPFMDQMLERIEKTMEVFMDDFSAFEDSFSSCLTNLDKMLNRCEETNLVLNWEKCHFMCREGIVLGHKIYKSDIEVDRAKVDIIAKLPHPTTVKGVRCFLGHAGFYRCFIQDFSKIARPMTHLLEKETPFFFSKECIEAFNTLKKNLTEAPILVVPDWNLPFELMCDASDYAIVAVLGQRKSKHFQPIHYSSKTMTEAQIHYTTTEKEMIVVVYAFEKFRPYLFLSKSIVYTNHSALKYFLNKQDAKPTVDYLSKWVEVKVLPTNDARVVVKFLKSLFSRFGTPRAIISDRGTHFCNDQFTRVMIKYEVTHRLATAYHPQTSGQVEVSNRGLKRILERTVGENRGAWSDKLDDALWAFRTAYKTPIGCTPYKLVYGKSCHLPIELEHRAYWALKHVNFDLKTAGDHRKLQLNELSELRDQAYENSVIYKERTKKLRDSKIKNCIFNVDDQVLLFNSRLKIFSGKLKTRWSSPFTITRVFPYGTIELSQPNGLNFKVNGHRVKHYFHGDIPSNVASDLHTFLMDN